MATDQPSSSQSVPTAGPSFADFLAQTTFALDALTTHAANLPHRSDLAFHRTLDRNFSRGLDGSSETVLSMTERLLLLVEGSGKGKGRAPKHRRLETARKKLDDEEDVVDGYRRSVLDVVDGLLEDAVRCTRLI
jgi:exosome complex exonuclease RRP6